MVLYLAVLMVEVLVVSSAATREPLKVEQKAFQSVVDLALMKVDKLVDKKVVVMVVK
jgi:hypothetical protein